jgi:uncharacterized membrane protein YbhN (UPF0104 family)
LKRTALVALKIAVSIGLLVYLFANTDLEALRERVRRGDLLLLAAAVVLYLVMLGIATWRWRLLLEAQGFRARMRPLSASYLVATFFNNFLPSNIGGDVIRVRDSSRLTGSTTTSLAVVAIDRILGFSALYVLAAIAYFAGSDEGRALAGADTVVLALGPIFGGLAFVFFRPGIARTLMRVSRIDRIGWARERFLVVQAAVHVYRERVGHVWIAFGASVALQALVVWYYYTIAHALSIPLPLSICFVMVPLCTLVQAVPISFNGWGIRESLFIVYFRQLGLPSDNALAFSVVGAGLIVLLSLSGALVWLARGETAVAADAA